MRVLAEAAPWMADAACHGLDPNLFLPERGQSTEPAKAICADCPVNQDYLDYALAQPWLKGVWGGTSERERRQLKAAQR